MQYDQKIIHETSLRHRTVPEEEPLGGEGLNSWE